MLPMMGTSNKVQVMIGALIIMAAVLAIGVFADAETARADVVTPEGVFVQVKGCPHKCATTACCKKEAAKAEGAAGAAKGNPAAAAAMKRATDEVAALKQQLALQKQKILKAQASPPAAQPPMPAVPLPPPAAVAAPAVAAPANAVQEKAKATVQALEKASEEATAHALKKIEGAKKRAAVVAEKDDATVGEINSAQEAILEARKEFAKAKLAKAQAVGAQQIEEQLETGQ